MNKSNEFEELDTFIELLSEKRQEPKIEVCDLKRIAELKNALENINKVVIKNSPGATIKCSLSEIDDGSDDIRIVTEDIIIDDISSFIKGIKTANNFEIYPLVDDKIQINIMFEGIKKQIK